MKKMIRKPLKSRRKTKKDRKVLLDTQFDSYPESVFQKSGAQADGLQN
jgi:hypothetical protein